MKKIVLSLALVGASFAFAQKKEIQNASKAIEKNDIAAAKAEISKAEGLLNNQLHFLEPSVLEEYYYAKGVLLIKEGKTREGVKTLVIWRNVETTTNEETAKKFRKIYDGIRSSEFDQIYINGDHHFDNMRTGEDTFKVKLIEETFFKQMFNISEL